jgi:squalene-associated FAD-dependent desaturase
LPSLRDEKDPPISISFPNAISPQPSVAVIGGGVAGLAAAVAAVQRGLHVELFEQAPAPGGRAGSYQDAKVKQLVDLSPHVTMGCCTNLLDFFRRTETISAFDRFAKLHFIGPDGRQYDFVPSRRLPAPLHLWPALWRLGYLSGSQRLAIGHAMLRLARYRVPEADAATMADWLRAQRQPLQCVRLFWALVLESALGDSLEHVSVAAARKVFVDGFLAARVAYEMFLPREPLGEVWLRAGKWLARHGVKLHMRTRIERLELNPCAAPTPAVAGEAPAPQIGLILAEGLCRTFDHVIAAVSWKQLGNLLRPELLKRIPRAEAGTELQSSPITAVHLWFDRPIMDLPHAALVGRLSQWIFNHNLSPLAEGDRETFHYTVVISASHALAGRATKDVLGEVLGEVKSIWPEASAAQLIHSRVLTQPGAVFSVRPGTDEMRPAQQTPIAGLYLAGDWTATDWPATMEGAARSGYLAVQSLLAKIGCPEQVVVPDLKRNRLAQCIVGQV